MYAASIEPSRVTLVLSLDELRLFNNALNEVVNGVDIPAAAFATRLGGTRSEVAHLLSSLHTVLDATEVMRSKRS
jgi:hypothetical protein